MRQWAVPLAAFSFVGWLFVVAPPASAPSGTASPVASLPASIAAIVASQPVEPPPPPRRPDRLIYRSHIDVPVTVIATGMWIVAEVEKVRLVAVNCKWCDRGPDGRDTLNGLDAWGRHALQWHDTGRAISISNITAYVLTPAVAYGLDFRAAARDGRRSDAVVDGILISQAVAIASDITEVMKFAISRERPFVHALAPLAKAETPNSADNNTSFPSGHTTLAFALVTSSSEIAALRGYNDTRWLLRAGLPLAVVTAYLRIAADRHYVTDVLAGAAAGSAAGFGVPYLAHRRKTDRRIPAVRVMPAKLGGMVAAQWTW